MLLSEPVAFAEAGAASSSERPSSAARDPQKPAAESPQQDDSVVVAEIGDHTITLAELKDRIRRDIRPSEDDIPGQAELPTAESAVRELLTEKAMVMEGRRQGYQRDAQLRSGADRQRRRQLIGLLLTDYVEKNLSISDAEIEQTLKARPQLTRDQAKSMVQRAKGQPLVERFYKELLAQYQVKKNGANLTRAAAIHDRLLNRPAEPRKVSWVKNSQVRDELSEEEKAIVLATYKGGQFTLLQWFEALCDIVPPRRPRDLNTAAGVEKLLDRALQPAILRAEAEARGYGRNEKLLSELRAYEDRGILGKVRAKAVADVNEPSDEQIKAFFDDHQEWFAESAKLKVDHIWCENLAAAREVKKKLDAGADFESLKQEHSLRKDSKPYDVRPSSEGTFWEELWEVAEPNNVVGPIRGFYGSGVRWRIVKVMEKTPAKARAYSDDLKNQVKWTMQNARRQALLAAYSKELLDKYPHKIHQDRIKSIDPLEVASEAEQTR
jgi:hypothetical protein